MAVIQIKRRTTAGTGPYTGTSGIIYAGEPQIDVNGGKLYVSKATKTGTVSVPIASTDYVSFPSEGKVDDQITLAIDDLQLGSASTKNTGTGNGNVPVLDASGKLADSVIPKIAITNTYVVSSQTSMLALTAQEGDVAVRTDLKKTYILKAVPATTLSNWQILETPTDVVTSVNGSTGAVTITLSGLGGVSSTSFNNHVGDATHLTTDQKSKLTDLENTRISENSSSLAVATDDLDTDAIANGILFETQLVPTNSSLPSPLLLYKIGINKSAVLTPSSIIDGGTY